MFSYLHLTRPIVLVSKVSTYDVCMCAPCGGGNRWKCNCETYFEQERENPNCRLCNENASISSITVTHAAWVTPVRRGRCVMCPRVLWPSMTLSPPTTTTNSKWSLFFGPVPCNRCECAHKRYVHIATPTLLMQFTHVNGALVWK